MSLTPVTPLKQFRPGTTGWTLQDLMDPAIEPLWQDGAYELSDGVLVQMPPALPFGNRRLYRLIKLLDRHLDGTPNRGEFAPEVDVYLTDDRVARVDAMYVTPGDDERQEQELARRGITDRVRVVQYAAPTLIIESISEGHERHDRVTKRRWYAEREVPNYWLLHTFERSLECLILDGPDYRVDRSGKDDDELKPSLFPGLVIRLGELWA
jgi:Uma2 family endonuclease